MDLELFERINASDISKALKIFDDEAIKELNELIKELDLKLIEV